MTDHQVHDSVAPEPASHEPVSRETVETQTTLEVGLVRTVRYGPILIGAAVLFAIIGVVVSLLFPVLEGADYTVGQVAGFMAVVGGAIGLVLGAVLALILGSVAKRRTGAAIAVVTDVK